MKKNSIFMSLVLTSGLFLGGCTNIPPRALSQASDNALICDGFVLLMEQGATNRAKEQAFILANRRAWHAQNFAVNDTPLPADLVPGAESVNLLEILQKDPRVRAKAKEIRTALIEETPPTPPSGSGN